ncbi:MAG TPA: dihydropteroate synthase, partial [bacterium]|nr:dihydropteroate synthase [bacterium]
MIMKEPEVLEKEVRAQISRTKIVGILNATPDSFYDGGRYTGLSSGLKRAGEMIAEGADIVEIGGESS